MRSYVEDHMREGLKNHVLVEHVNDENCKAFYLKEPRKGRMMSCLIVFTCEGIVIMGDLTPCQNGVISCYGYALHWFARRLSEDYLCEKFLKEEFRPDLAIADFKWRLLEKRRSDGRNPAQFSRRKNWLSKERARDAWEWLERHKDELTMQDYYEEYCDVFEDTPESGYGYNLGDAGWLCAIQQKFAELYQKEQGRVAELADAPASRSGEETRPGSSPGLATIQEQP